MTKKFTTSFITTPLLSKMVKEFAKRNKVSMGSAIRTLLGAALLKDALDGHKKAVKCN